VAGISDLETIVMATVCRTVFSKTMSGFLLVGLLPISVDQSATIGRFALVLLSVNLVFA